MEPTWLQDHSSTTCFNSSNMDQNTSNINNRLLLFLCIIFMTAVVIIKRRLDRMAVDLRLINHERYMHRERPNRSFVETIQTDRARTYTPEQLRERREREQARRHEEWALKGGGMWSLAMLGWTGRESGGRGIKGVAGACFLAKLPVVAKKEKRKRCIFSKTKLEFSI